jgi:ribosomal protein L7/L12
MIDLAFWTEAALRNFAIAINDELVRRQVEGPRALVSEETALVRAHDLIAAIKAYRARTGTTLREAKDAIEAYRDRAGL